MAKTSSPPPSTLSTPTQPPSHTTPQRIEPLNYDAPPQGTDHPSPLAQSNSNGWIPFQILLAIALTAALILFAAWASSLIRSHRRRRRQRHTPVSAIELPAIVPPSRNPSTADDGGATHGQNGHGPGGGNAKDNDTPPPTTGHERSTDTADRVPSQRDSDATVSAQPSRAYPRRAEGQWDGMPPVEGVEMV